MARDLRQLDSPAELRELTATLGGDYVWEIGEDSTGRSPLPMTYMIGYPRRPPAAG